MSHTSKVIVISGAANGIGKGIAEACLAKGYEAVVADIDREAGKQIKQVEFIETDVGNEASVIKLKKHVESKYGQIEALINNAADANPNNTPLSDLSLEEWNQKINTNLSSVFLMSKHFNEIIIDQGSIVNISSIRAYLAEENTEAYMAAKAGVLGLTRALAASLKHRLRVNSISPGWIQNPRISAEVTSQVESYHYSGRIGKFSDIANLALFLISDQASFITGQDLLVDGGASIRLSYPE